MTIEKFNLMLAQRTDSLFMALNGVRTSEDVETIAEVCYGDWPIWSHQ